MQISRLARTAALLAVCGVSAMCTPDHPAAPSRETPPLDASRLAVVAEHSRLPHAAAGTAWAADLHTQAMQQWTSGRRTLRTLPRPEACARLLRMVRSYLPEVEKKTSLVPEGLFNRVVDDAGARAGCAPREPLAMFGRRLEAALHLYQGEGDTIVTGAYESFEPAIQAALDYAGSADEATTAVDGVLIQASGIPAADFALLSQEAALAASSAWYWYEYQQAAGGGDGQAEMAVFRRQVHPGGFSWRECASADLKGAIGAVAVARALGVVHPLLLGAALFGGAAVGSAWYAWPYMME